MKHLSKYLFLAATLVFGFAACQEEPKEDPAVFSISADAQFTNSVATVTVTADKALGADANVALVLESKSTLPEAALAFNDKAIIKKGAKEASVTVTLDDSQLKPGTYEAVFTAKVNDQAVPGEAKVSANVLAPGITISADEALTEGKAKIKVTASKTVVEPIDVALALAATNTVPKDNVTIPEKITVASGQTEATGEIVVDLEKLPYGEFVLAVTATAGEASQTFSYQVKKELPAITAAGILALTPTTDQQEAAFVGGIKDLVVTYKAPTGDVYAKDATGYLYIFGDKTLKVGDVINGEVSGKVLTYYGVHEIKSFDYSKATVTNGTAPEPEAITISEILKNFDAKENAYVKLTGVVNEADIVKSDKGTNNNISQGDDKIVLYIQKNTDIATVEAESTFDVTGVVTLYKKDDNVTKEVKIWEPAAISNVKAPTKVATFERVWGKYPIASGKAWTTEYTSTGSFIVGNDRTATMDEDYIYVAAASSSKKGILAIDIKDPTKIKEVNVTGVEGGLFPTACVRTIYNPATRKHILLVGSLAFDGDYTFNLYAYMNGIDAAPTKVLSWATNNRRFGDFFTVSGDAAKGEVWIRINDGSATTTVIFNVVNGAITNASSPIGGGIGYAASAGMGSCYKYNVDANQVLVETPNIGLFYNYTASTWIESASGVLWAGKDQSVMNRKFGLTPFEYNGEKYIAYMQMGKYTDPANGARGRLKVIKDQGSADTYLASIEADNVVYECPLQNKNDNAKTAEEFDEVYFTDNPSYSGQVMGNCAVVAGTDCVYIMAHQYNVGLSLFKLSMKVQK